MYDCCWGVEILWRPHLREIKIKGSFPWMSQQIWAEHAFLSLDPENSVPYWNAYFFLLQTLKNILSPWNACFWTITQEVWNFILHLHCAAGLSHFQLDHLGKTRSLWALLSAYLSISQFSGQGEETSGYSLENLFQTLITSKWSCLDFLSSRCF